MNTNCIRKDGFSNPATERLYKSWSRHQVFASLEALQDCGSCLSGLTIFDSAEDDCWLLCGDQASPCFLETVHWTFRCPHQTHDPDTHNLEPWEYPDLLDDLTRGPEDLGSDDE
jgi:hypothetical protein